MVLACAALATVGCGHREGLLEQDQATGDVRLKVQVANTSEPALEISLTNYGPDNLVLSDSQLPWSDSNFANMMTLRAFAGSEDGPELERLYSCGHSVGIPDTVIAPGATASGTLPLGGYFLDLYDVLAQSDVVVFWHYLFDPPGRDKRWLRGSVVIPRFTKPHPPPWRKQPPH